jgi:hypothetical protein
MIFYILYASTNYSNLISYFLIDAFIRTDLNATGISNLFWLWTNTYYLYSIMIVLLFLLTISFYPKINSLALLLILLYTYAILIEIAINSNLSLNLTHKPYDLEMYNLLLNNGINKIHPLMIYLSWFSIAKVISYSYESLRYSLLNNFFIYQTTITTSLLLGGWWAYQEGSWGGWWNWDPSEMFGLIIFSILIILTHLMFSNNKYQYISIKAITIYTFVYYIFLQLNFSLLSHNFGIRQGDIIDFRLSYVITSLLLLYLIHTGLKRLFSSSKINVYNIRYTLWAFLFIFLLYSSSAELWSDLSWRLLSIDLYNSTNLLKQSLILLLALTCLNYITYKYSLLLALTITLISNSHLTVLYVVLASVALNRFISLHIIILSSLFYTLMFSNFTSNTYCFSNYTPSSLITLNLPLLHSSYLNILETLTPYYYSMLSSNTPDTKPFILSNVNSTTHQVYSIQLDDVWLSSNSLEFYNIVIIISVASLSYLFCKIISTKYVIKF